ncbi:MAG: hypothetical protein NVS3B12_17600 [Acidimicrobiales bacterium]
MDRAAGAAALLPRSGLIAEIELGAGQFGATAGPVTGYRRTVVVRDAGDGLSDVQQTVEYRLAVPLVGWLMARAVRRRIGRIGSDDRPPWWGPPDHLTPEAWAALSALGVLAATIGYLSTLLTQTITYSAAEFGAGPGAQGVALAVVRGDIVLSIVLMRLADRRGRRIVVVGGGVVGALLTAAGGAAPSLAWLAASQVLARGFVTASSIAAAVLVAEAMPSNARAWAIGIVAMATALGAGVCVLALPLAGLGIGGWRLLYVGALGWLALIALAQRHLLESPRYVERSAERVASVRIPPRLRDLWGRRLALLSAAFLLLQVFITPATQFRNEFLRHERGFSAGRISLYTVVTFLPGAIGIVVGGRLADSRGRRQVAIVAVLGAAVGGTIAYSVAGWPMWVASAVASLTGAAVIPALSVYGPELFGTDLRGSANGVLSGAGRIGSVIGLLVAGSLSQALGHFGPAFAVLAIGPVALALLIVVGFPETAHRALEDLSPDDGPTSPPLRPGRLRDEPPTD